MHKDQNYILSWQQRKMYIIFASEVISNKTPKHQIWYSFISNKILKLTSSYQIWCNVNSVYIKFGVTLFITPNL